ncbi:hypothetical protein ACFSVJ_00255 [Prauserella oleivorans]
MSSLGPQTGAAGTAAPKQPLVALAAVLCLAAAPSPSSARSCRSSPAR